MATSTIPMLPQLVAATGTEQLEAVANGSSVRMTSAQIAALGGPTGPTGPTGPSGTGPTGPTGPTGVAGPASGLTSILTANLPSATTSQGVQYLVTDSSVNTFYTLLVGGGAYIVPAFSDGTNWWVG